MTSLVIGTSFDVDDAKYSNCLTMPFDLQFDQGDNNDGVTILDVSDLSRVRYCFVAFASTWEVETDEDEDEDEKPSIPDMAPLSGARYLSAYEPYGEDWHGSLLSAFEKLPLVELAALEDTWPRDDWSRDLASQPNNTEDDQTKSQISAAQTSLASLSLRDLAMGKTLEQLLDTPGDELEAVLAEAEQLTDFKRVALQWLIKHPDLLKDSLSGVVLLARVLMGEKSVDLSMFSNFGDKELALLFEKAKLQDTVELLDLSGNNNITESSLKLTTGCKSLKALYVLNVPGLSLSSTFTTVRQLPINEFYHTDYLRRAFVQDKTTELSLPPLSGFQHPVQLLYGAANEIGQQRRLSAGGIPWTLAFNQRPDLTSVRLKGALTSVESLAFSLSRMIHQCAGHGWNGFNSTPSFFCGQLSLGSASVHKINAIPGQPYNNDKYMYSGFSDAPRTIKSGEWTIVLIEDMPEYTLGITNMRYAMVTRDENLKAVDFPTYATLVAEAEGTVTHLPDVIKLWEGQLQCVKDVTQGRRDYNWDLQVCTAEEVQELVMGFKALLKRQPAMLRPRPDSDDEDNDEVD